MNKVIVWLVVMVSLVVVGKYSLARYEEKELLRKSRTRVDKVFSLMKVGTGTGTDVQTAICLWAENKVFISDRDLLSRYSDQFDEWREAKNLYRSFDSYEITAVELRVSGASKIAVVTVKVEGAEPLQILVEPGTSLRWMV